MTEQEEIRLVNMIVYQDANAFSTLVDLYQPKIYAMTYHSTRNEQDAMDLTQEIFLKIYQKLSSFQFNSRLSTWIYTIASRTCVDYARKQKGSVNSVSLSPDSENDSSESLLPDHRWDPETELEQKERRILLLQAVDQLESEYREVLLLREFESLSYQEISDRIHIPVGTVKSRIARGREDLRQILREDETFFDYLSSKQAVQDPKGGLSR